MEYVYDSTKLVLDGQQYQDLAHILDRLGFEHRELAQLLRLHVQYPHSGYDRRIAECIPTTKQIVDAA